MKLGHIPLCGDEMNVPCFPYNRGGTVHVCHVVMNI